MQQKKQVALKELFEVFVIMQANQFFALGVLEWSHNATGGQVSGSFHCINQLPELPSIQYSISG